MRHDPKTIEARHQAFRAHYDGQVKALDDQIAQLTKQRDEIGRRINAEWKTFPDGLIYSATARCKCGAGLCYEEGTTGPGGAWTCSICVLADRAKLPLDGWDKNAHQYFPFREYEIKSEDQPSAMGMTTRPDPEAVR